jgi:peptidoglycan/LPS O-acetylase OafA/YrhL
VLIVFPLLVFWGTSVDPGPRVQQISGFLGVTSYAIYVLHSPLASVLNSVSRVFAGGVGAVAPYVGIAVLVVLLVGCWLIDRWLDIPIRRHLARIVPRMRALPARS